MSEHIPESRPHDVETVGRSGSDFDDDLWGDVPREERLAWLRVASRHWPFFPGAAVGGLTAHALFGDRLVRSESLIRIARRAAEAGFTPLEYDVLRGILDDRAPEHLVKSRDARPEHSHRYYEIDARQWRAWLDRVRTGQSPQAALEWFLGTQTSTPEAVGQEQPIFVEGRFGTIETRTQVIDPSEGPVPRLSDGVELPADVSPEEFARVWSEFLGRNSSDFGDRLRWAYIVQPPGEVGRPSGVPCTLPEALERLRTEPGSRLYRRAEGDWRIAPTPLPRVLPAQWAPLEGDLRDAWYHAISTRPPSRMSTISRRGGAEMAPDDWRMLARRAHALGFTPSDYKQLVIGVSLLCEENGASVPEPYDIEFWAEFAAVAQTADTPLDAARTVARRRAVAG